MAVLAGFGVALVIFFVMETQLHDTMLAYIVSSVAGLLMANVVNVLLSGSFCLLSHD